LKLIAREAASLDPLSVGKSSFAELASAQVNWYSPIGWLQRVMGTRELTGRAMPIPEQSY
jgi:hypothetical protein